MKKLPIGIQSFAKLVLDGYMYVDKTEYCHRLITGGNYYFLSRLRRFGRSLLVSTLKEIFLGNRDLFEGLWIHAHTSAEGVESDPIAPGSNWGWWEPCPVIHLDFSLIMSIETPLAANLEIRMDEIAAEHGLAPLAGDYAQKFNALIRQLGAKRKVAILVDEYDKPIIHYIDEPEMAERNRAVLENFYSVLKGNDEHIQFLLLTGVTKFTQVSIFPNLLAEFSEKGEQQSSMLIIRMAKQLREGNADEFIQSLTTLVDGIGYPIQPAGKSGIENHEKYYHTMFYLVLRMLGYDIETEVRTSRGSIDAVITTERYRYVVEFKLSDAATAMAQIKARGYHQKYLGAGKQVILLGIGFDTVQRNIADYLVEEAG